MNKLISLKLFLFLLIIPLTNFGQNSDIDEWRELIKSTNFHKITIKEDGVYKITYDQLKVTGFPIANIEMNDLRLFRRGVEIAIKIDDFDNDNIFDPEDFFIFYGEKNNSLGDHDLFNDGEHNINPYVSFFTDKSAYFLNHKNVNSFTPPKRINNSNYNSNGLVDEVNYFAKKLILFRGDDVNYSVGSYAKGLGSNSERTVFSSLFNEERGWTSFNYQWLKTETVFDINLDGIDRTSNEDIILKTRFKSHIYFDNKIEYKYGKDTNNLTTLGTEVVPSYGASKLLTHNLPITTISSQGNLILSAHDLNSGNLPTQTNQFGVVYFDILYPKRLDFNNQQDQIMYWLGKSAKKIKVDNYNSQIIFLDITDPYNAIELEVTNSCAVLPPVNSNNERKVIYSSSFNYPLETHVAHFESFEGTNETDFLLISHQLTQQSYGSFNNVAQAYADYRSSESGGEQIVYHADIDALINTFSFGDFSSLAVKKAIDELSRKKLKYVLLLGKGLQEDEHHKKNQLQGIDNLIPSYGYPCTDQGYVFNLVDKPTVSIGRISATSASKAGAYLSKLIEFENMDFRNASKRKALHLSGGSDINQINQFSAINDSYKDILENSLLAGSVTHLKKVDDGTYIGTFDKSSFASHLNNGVGVISYFGHSAPSTTGLLLGYPDNKTNNYNNTVYPFMVMLGCSVGNVFISHDDVLGERWVNSEKNGAIGFWGSTSLITVYDAETIGDQFYTLAYNKYVGKPIGDVIVALQNQLIDQNSSPNIIKALQNFTLVGDPALSIGIEKSDYWIDDVTYTTYGTTDKLHHSQDSTKFTIQYGNDGIIWDNEDREIVINIERKYPSGIISETSMYAILKDTTTSGKVDIMVHYSDLDSALGGGENILTFTIGNQLSNDNKTINTMDEYDFNNNTKTLSLFYHFDPYKAGDGEDITSISNNILDISVSPNPASNTLSIQRLASKFKSLRIIGVNGTLYQEENISLLNDVRLNISNLKNGLYIIHLIGDNENKIVKLIKN
ncbi:T9SS type A sorting domain-containing protein [Flammeovirga pectinis]|uniref:T9SS type A sorting domain-containing protein n=1 Tax=Flammeovirga pectinis TaxID=2494373 RepID=A0A3S9P929_9BACT|nr:C25 family cysteine peptidase [Flammeovirga pectinis]AZQ64699.1 T9SS type A sorting domain-containing protein [Flammeovirga pectinis]